MPSSVPGTGEKVTVRYRNVLVPTEGSKGARRGMEHALDIAEQFGATIHVLHVVDERNTGGTPALSSHELAIEKIEEEGDRIMAEVVAAAESRDLDASATCIRGVPHDVILQYAAEHGIDLIVMGIHGEERSARPHVGSTTDRVLRTASIPVLPV